MSTPNSVGGLCLGFTKPTRLLSARSYKPVKNLKHWFDGKPKQRLEKNLKSQGHQSVSQTFGKAKVRMLKNAQYWLAM